MVVVQPQWRLPKGNWRSWRRSYRFASCRVFLQAAVAASDGDLLRDPRDFRKGAQPRRAPELARIHTHRHRPAAVAAVVAAAAAVAVALARWGALAGRSLASGKERARYGRKSSEGGGEEAEQERAPDRARAPPRKIKEN